MKKNNELIANVNEAEISEMPEVRVIGKQIKYVGPDGNVFSQKAYKAETKGFWQCPECGGTGYGDTPASIRHSSGCSYS